MSGGTFTRLTLVFFCTQFWQNNYFQEQKVRSACGADALGLQMHGSYNLKIFQSALESVRRTQKWQVLLWVCLNSATDTLQSYLNYDTKLYSAKMHVSFISESLNNRIFSNQVAQEVNNLSCRLSPNSHLSAHLKLEAFASKEIWR